MNNKKSSVGLLIEIIGNYDEELLFLFREQIKQAKEMHKSEIIWAHGIKMKGVNNLQCVSGEQYHNETYGGGEL
jgi:hypothetical protein